MATDLFAGGACNFKNSQKAPFFSMTSCGNQALFKDGAGCGACYQVLPHYHAYMAPAMS
jgi:hypothetical protein